MNITVNDLEKNISLDKKAMSSLLGGWHNHSTSTTYGNYSSTGWSSWVKNSILTEKRFRDRYRTKTVTTRQHQRDYQFRAVLSVGF